MIDSEYVEMKFIEDINILYRKRVIIFGAGECGREIYAILRSVLIAPIYICDNAPKKWQSHIGNTEIISPKYLENRANIENVIIVTAVKNIEARMNMLDQLNSMGIDNDYVYHASDISSFIFRNIEGLDMDLESRRFLEQVYNLKKAAFAHSYKLVVINRVMEYFSFVNTHQGADKIVLVYQVGKVGSSTIQSSLSAIGVPSLHLHFLARLLMDDFGVNDVLSGCLNKLLEMKKVKIITLVREPLGQIISRFFQNMGEYQENFFLYEKLEGNSLTDMFRDYIMKSEGKAGAIGGYDWRVPIPLRKALVEGNNLYGWFQWFDAELRSTFDIDVFEYPFDKEKGYSIIKRKNIEVLVMKLEKLSSLESVIGEFVEEPGFRMVNSNVAEDKEYKNIYRMFKKVVQFPSEIVSLYYRENRQMDHFYAEEEKAFFLERWGIDID
jgi:hypothetical protein